MRIQESQPSRPKLPPFNAKHVIAAKEAAEKNTPSIPEFSDLLVNNFATGRSSGAEAAYLQNRGLMYNHAAGREEWQWLSILYPDDLAEAIYAQGEDIFRKCMFGDVDAMCSKEHLFGWSDKGYCYMFSSLQGDLKWVHEKYGLHNFRANACCSTCGALKTADDLSMTIADFRPGASHVGTEPNLDEFYAMDPCIFELATRDRVLHDCMHSQLLGTGKVCNGSALIYLAESGYWGAFPTGRGAGKYDDCLETCLRAAHRDFIFWKKGRKIQTSQSRFTPARCGRKNRQQYPALNNKAAASKACTMWLAERTCEFAARADATEQDQLVCTTVHSYALALLLMDETELLMSEERATRFYNLMMRHLQTHALLNKRSRLLVGKAVGRNMWLIMPKHHHLFHAAHRVLTERVNPRAWALFAGEDFVGRVARIARVCHRLTVSQRTLQRYLALVYLELQNLKS
ncbi:unnamed protein product [Durusdinium trenchii]|uniref:Uncharacterized protein n=1 Tax=Durusdinium trenchii TaxID=1381693 RepID=A0ABP0T285_9DINO